MAFEVKNPRAVWQLEFEGAWPTSVAFAGDSSRIVAGNREGALLLWELPEEPPVVETDEVPTVAPSRSLTGHGNGIARVVALPGGSRVVSASLDRTVRVWDVTATPTGTTEVVVDARKREAEAKKARNDEALKRPGVMVETISAEHTFEGHGDWVLALGTNADGSRLVSGDDGGLVSVRDTEGKELSRWNGWPGNGVVSACLSPDGTTAFVAEYRAPRGDFDRPPAMARLYDAATGELKVDVLRVQFPEVKEPDNSYGYSTKWRKFVGRGFVASAFSPDGGTLALGQGGETGDAKVHLVDVETGKVRKTVSNHRYGICDVAFSADGSHLLTAGRDTMVKVIRVSDGEEVAALGKSRGGQFKDWMHAIAISPDQRFVAGADIAGMVHVWQLATA